MSPNRARPEPATVTAGAESDVIADLQARAANAASRIARIGIPKQELAQRAGIDRGTLGRALKADPRTLANDARTWRLIERELDRLEEEIGLGVIAPPIADELVESTVEYQGARITLSGRADAVADAIRRVLEGTADV